MPRGKVKIKFVGGFLDGNFYDNVDSRVALNELHEASGSWYRKSDSGEKVEVIMGGQLDRNWIGFLVHIYKKMGKGDDGYLQYKFVREKLVERCTAFTKTARQCMKSRFKDLQVCESHK